MRDDADARAGAAEIDAPFLQGVAERVGGHAGAGDVEEHDVGLDLLRVDLDARQVAQRLREQAGVGVILGEALDIVLERIDAGRSEEQTSELQSLMRISSAVFSVKKKK